MKNMNHFGDRAWNRFFDFVFPDERNLGRQGVQAELKRLGIDMGPSLAKLSRMLEQTRESQDARAALESARKERPSLLARLSGIGALSGPEIRETLQRMIAERFTGTTQTAYARKLEGAASDEDLRSLLEDVSRLEAFSEGSDNGES